MTSSELLDAVRRMLDLLGPDRPGASLPRQLVDVLQALFPCDAAALLRLEGDTLRPLAVAGLSHDTLGRRFRLQDHPRLLTLLQRRGSTRLASDCQLPDPYDGLVEGRTGQLEVHDCMGCPLYRDDQPWGKTLTLAQLETMHRHKTGALIEASVRMGALAAGANGTAALTALTDYARTLGLAFQVQDDLLDVEGDTDVIGKPQGSDAARAKPTYPALLGLAGAKEHLATLRQATLASLDSFGPEADPLRAMADFVVARSH